MRPMRHALRTMNAFVDRNFEPVVVSFSALVVASLIIGLAIRGGTP